MAMAGAGCTPIVLPVTTLEEGEEDGDDHPVAAGTGGSRVGQAGHARNKQPNHERQQHHHSDSAESYPTEPIQTGRRSLFPCLRHMGHHLRQVRHDRAQILPEPEHAPDSD